MNHSKHLLQTGATQGELALRIEIAHYLYQSRGIECTARTNCYWFWYRAFITNDFRLV